MAPELEALPKTGSWEGEMEAKVDEIADGVYRISAYVPEIAPPQGFTYNHFLVLGDEPLLFHTGLRRMFPSILAAARRFCRPRSCGGSALATTRPTSAAR